MSGVDMVVEPDGTIRMVYNEIVDPHCFGLPTISRGSHVEPTADGRWTADLCPVSGPVLGPFDTRRQALAAEVAWLRDSWLLPAES